MPASDLPRRRSRAAFVLKFLLTAALAAAVVVFALAPPGPRATPSAGPPDARAIAGAYHIHTTRSDGALDRDAVARAAARAGLKFAIFTDHGDGTRPPAAPEYLHGVLCVDGVEVSTNDGHYVAIGIGQSPYPLGGDADAVAEDVARLGGLGIAAHPFSARRELGWHDWTIPLDGLEWLNADSEWRDERRSVLGRALVGYLVRPAAALASLMDRPVASLAKWDELARTRRVLALPAHDAHGGVGAESGDITGRRLHLPSYDATFRSFSMRVTLGSAPTGNAARDAEVLIAAIRAGAVFSVIDAIAAPGSLDFRAVSGNAAVAMGGTLPSMSDTAMFTVRADVPPAASTRLLRNGEVIAERGGGVLDHPASDPGSYRVEIHVAGAPGTPAVPWLVSNPIFKFPAGPDSLAPVPPLPDFPVPLPEAPWRTEASAGSMAALSGDAAAVSFGYRLAPGNPASQFAALVRDLPGAPDASAIAFTARASRPMRVSAQLRFAKDGDRRWRRSFYVDTIARAVIIPTARLRPADGPGALPPITRASSLLLVIDLTNAAPGAEGTLVISALQFVR